MTMLEYGIILIIAYVALHWDQIIEWRINMKRRSAYKRSSYYYMPAVTDSDFPYEPMEW